MEQRAAIDEERRRREETLGRLLVEYAEARDRLLNYLVQFNGVDMALHTLDVRQRP